VPTFPDHALNLQISRQSGNQALDGVWSLNISAPPGLARKGARCRRWSGIQRTFLYRPQTNELSFEITQPVRCLASMMEVTVTKRRRSWEWRVHDHNGALLMHGRERTRPAARYQGYRSLFMLLAVGRRRTAFKAAETFPTTDQSDSGASRSWSS
jgi:hypothetical protein